MAQTKGASFFDGLSEAEIAEALAKLERRIFPAGSVVVSEGDRPGEMYVIRGGGAEASIMGADGAAHVVNRLGPGSVIGEMSLLTGLPASATVRSIKDLEVVVLNQDRFQHLTRSFPQLFVNLGAILSKKLAQADRRSLQPARGSLTLLLEGGSSPALGYAVACSVAWHARRRVIPLAFTSPSDGAAPISSVLNLAGDGSDIVSIAERLDHAPHPRAHYAALAPDSLDAYSLSAFVEALRVHVGHVFVQIPESSGPISGTPSMLDGRHVRLRDVSIPSLSADDKHLLQTGMLPPRSGAGQALGWLARDLLGLKVGLALGAGGAKGYGHIGVLRVLADAGLPVDTIAGTSIGACVAALRASESTPDAMADALDKLGSLAWRPTASRSALLSNRRLREGFEHICGDRRIEELSVPLGIVAADIVSQCEVVFRHGLLWPALLASIAIPGIFPAQCLGPYTLVDGGVVNPVPGDVAASLGADAVVAVKLASRSSRGKVEAESVEMDGPSPSIVQTITRSIEIMQSRITMASVAAATIQIEVDFSNVEDPGLRRFSEGRRFMALGEEAARQALPRLAAVFPWLAGSEQ